MLSNLIIIDGHSIYCCHGELKRKRDLRNPWKRQNGYSISSPELKELLEYNGREFFNGKLPWD